MDRTPARPDPPPARQARYRRELPSVLDTTMKVLAGLGKIAGAYNQT